MAMKKDRGEALAWGIIGVANLMGAIAVLFFGWVPSQEMIAAIAFMGAMTACGARMNQTLYGS